MEVVDTMIRRRINILCSQETKWVGEKAKLLDNSGFKLWYSGVNTTRNGVCSIIDGSMKDDVVQMTRRGDRILSLKLILGCETINIFSVYAPQVDLDESIKAKFWEDLVEMIGSVSQGEQIFVGGDLNGHVGRDNEDYEEVHGGYGYGGRNEEGKSILKFGMAFDLCIINTFFKKREEHLVTFKSGSTKSHIDFLLTRKRDRRVCRDCKIIPGECLTSQHRLLVVDLRFKHHIRRRNLRKSPRIKWRNLKKEKEEIFKEDLLRQSIWDLQGESDILWNDMATRVRIMAKKILGESRGYAPMNKESWWWEEGVQNKIKVKRANYKALYSCRSDENIEKYKLAKKESKKAVNEERDRAFEDFYQKLESKEGERDIYKIAKARAHRTKDLTQVKCIKDESNKVLVRDEEIKERWERYFHHLFNEDNGDDIILGELAKSEEYRNALYY
ncbi:hypothetical protein ACH5RR_021463 [Cinchona calisaya]|uniref:Craniofacial development protein 2-like n=1 Tax=Cinchona calisaya TaxID=153742 RepID=A0ABD2ZIA6_9GENT